MQFHDVPPLNSLILKVASRCNLNCTYCYVYNKEDQTWEDKPWRMSDEVYSAALNRMLEHARSSRQKTIALTFHGGEPTLLGKEKLRQWIEEALQLFNGEFDLRFKVQTNGTLINSDWASLFAHYDVNVGVSIDGPPEIHDRFRVDHIGNGSHAKVELALRHLQDAGVSFGILSVIQLGSDPLSVYRHFRQLGCDSISFILPDYSHDNITNIRSSYGRTPCADFLIPIFDEWWMNPEPQVRIRNFWTIIKLLRGGESQSDTFGNSPFGFCVVESDGEIEGLDCLRVCSEGITKTGGNVLKNAFAELARLSPFQHKVIFEGIEKPDSCNGCTEENTCGGGYLPHRYSKSNGFNNSSVWCSDILKLFQHIRSELGLPATETLLRRAALRSLSEFQNL